MLEHSRLARGWGIPHAYDPHNGEMIRLSKDGAEVVDIVPSGQLHEDSGYIVRSDDDGLRLRRKMAYAGHISVSLAYNNKGKILSGPEPRISGFPEGPNGIYMEELLDLVADEAEDAFYAISSKARQDEDTVEERIRSRIKKLVRQKTDKRAIVEVTAHRI